jgi:hypothetical protein
MNPQHSFRPARPWVVAVAKPAVEQLEDRRLLTAGGFGPVPLAMGIVQSLEARADFITSEYQTLLHRSPDGSGLNSWLNQLNGGQSREAVEAGIVSSHEYFATHGDNNAAWLTNLYQDLLGRSPDANGFADWLNRLAGGESTYQVALGFATSTERELRLVGADYRAILGRALEAEAIDNWMSTVQASANREQVVIDIVSSDEFYLKNHSSDRGYIDVVYQTVLARRPNRAEVDHWFAVLTGLVTLTGT